MKNYSFVVLLMLYFHMGAQTLPQTLRANFWFISEGASRPEAYNFTKEKPPGPYTEVRFLSNGHFVMKPDGWGDFKFVCPYELKKDIIKIYYSINTPKEKIKKENVAHYYRIRQQQSTGSLELVPVKATDFK